MIKITLINSIGNKKCHHGHNIADVFIYETDKDKLCPLAMHTLFPMIEILKYGGKLPSNVFCCPDAETINIFKIEISE